MTERPILFSAPMVRAILAGNKSQTRRVVKPQPTEWTTPNGPGMSAIWPAVNIRGYCEARVCPYGHPGDRLWVRETWSTPQVIPRSDDPMWPGMTVVYRAENDFRGYAWRPSIHMPRWASRLLLEVLSVRVERVQSIGLQDLRAEGATWDGHNWTYSQDIPGNPDILVAFMELWDSINAKRGFGWDMNPWVWVVEFKRVQP